MYGAIGLPGSTAAGVRAASATRSCVQLLACARFGQRAGRRGGGALFSLRAHCPTSLCPPSKALVLPWCLRARVRAPCSPTAPKRRCMSTESTLRVLSPLEQAEGGAVKYKMRRPAAARSHSAAGRQAGRQAAHTRSALAGLYKGTAPWPALSAERAPLLPPPPLFFASVAPLTGLLLCRLCRRWLRLLGSSVLCSAAARRSVAGSARQALRRAAEHGGSRRRRAWRGGDKGGASREVARARSCCLARFLLLRCSSCSRPISCAGHPRWARQCGGRLPSSGMPQGVVCIPGKGCACVRACMRACGCTTSKTRCLLPRLPACLPACLRACLPASLSLTTGRRLARRRRAWRPPPRLPRPRPPPPPPARRRRALA